MIFKSPLHPTLCPLVFETHDFAVIQAYADGIHKSKYWEPAYEDSMDLIAKLPVVAATIYNNLFKEGATPCPIDPEKDWSYNFTEMIGYKDPMFTELMRLYLTIHR